MNKEIREFKLLRWSVPVLALLVAGALDVYAQNNTESGADHVTVPLSDPAQPATLRASLVNGGITVKGYDGKDILVKARVRGGGGPARSEGNMKRIPISATGLTVEEENNHVRVGSDSVGRAIDLTISVPHQTSLTLHTVNDGDIVVSDVRGDLEVDDVNGAVTLNHISGSVIAHALNEGIKATFDHLAQKPMAFSSLNGKIDVTFPADLHANLSLRSDMGDVFSDFDVQMQASTTQPMIEDSRGQGGKYKVKMDKTIHGTIGGGGPEIQFTNFHGEIYIRKAGAAQ
ncbi:MAG TPA: hypothetical protein VN862_01220 [Candidatus Acidoferrales bacterium]|nr:hypothetical protein [Candidatus Acidoferrales bacterium]